MPAENVYQVNDVFVRFTNHFIDEVPFAAGYIHCMAENGFIIPE